MTERDIGRVLGQLELVVATQGEILSRLLAVEKAFAERQGERRVTLWVASTMSAVLGSALTAFARFLLGHRA